MNSVIFSLFLSSSFLLADTDIHQKYIEALQNGVFEKVLKERSEKGQKFDEFSQTDEFREAHAEWDQRLTELEQQRNQALLAACQDESDLEISQIVKRVVSFSLTEEEKAAYRAIYGLQYQPLESAKSEDEKTLLQIDVEYECKLLLLDWRYSQKKIDKATQVSERQALLLEKVEKMAAAADQFTDKQLQSQVKIAARVYPQYQAFKADREALLHLGRGATPANETEKRVAEIMADYLKQRQALYKKEFLSKIGVD